MSRGHSTDTKTSKVQNRWASHPIEIDILYIDIMYIYIYIYIQICILHLFSHTCVHTYYVSNVTIVVAWVI